MPNMKSYNVLQMVYLLIFLGAAPLDVVASSENAPKVSLTEISPSEILQFDSATLYARFKDDLISDKLSQEQKDAVRSVLMREMSSVQAETRQWDGVGRVALLAGAGLLGWFIRRWYRNNFT